MFPIPFIVSIFYVIEKKWKFNFVTLPSSLPVYWLDTSRYLDTQITTESKSYLLYIISFFVEFKLVYSIVIRFLEKFRFKRAFLSLRAAVWE